MKTGKRSYPLDQLSVSDDGVSVSIHTHRSQIVVSVDDGELCMFASMEFDQFAKVLLAHLSRHGERTPSMMKGLRKSERSRYTGVEEGK